MLHLLQFLNQQIKEQRLSPKVISHPEQSQETDFSALTHTSTPLGVTTSRVYPHVNQDPVLTKILLEKILSQFFFTIFSMHPETAL